MTVRIGYVVHDLNDAAVLRRVRMFEAGGAAVTLAGFRRGATIAPAIAALDPVDLGQTADAALARRAGAVLRRALRPGPLTPRLHDADAIVARNLESLAIARRIVGQRPLVYECLDIHRSLVSRGAAGRVVQTVEAALLSRVDLLLTSSPAFVDAHFRHRPTLRAPTLLVENKVSALDGLAPVPVASPPAPPFVIGWFGMLRCRRTLAELSSLARAMAGRVEILVAGKPSPAEFPDWEAAIAGVPHLSYAGPYTAGDLPTLYGRCHFAWTIDWFEEGLNSSWLLPNRLYEAQAYGVVPIVDAGVEAGRWLAGVDAGVRLTGGTDELATFLAALDGDGYARLRAAVAAVPRERLIATAADADALVARISGLPGR